MEECGFDAKRGRVIVTDQFTDPKHDAIYIIGDVDAVMPPEGKRPYPTTAKIATAMAGYKAEEHVSSIKTGQHEAKPFTSTPFCTVASGGKTRAFGETTIKKIIADPYFLSELKLRKSDKDS
ncbi:hypothetical protein BBP12_11130 [Limosilactobacillus reuteri]|nr:hypothetical protein BBP12_11130 [Limosilactobacillus reuteri]